MWYSLSPENISDNVSRPRLRNLVRTTTSRLQNNIPAKKAEITPRKKLTCSMLAPNLLAMVTAKPSLGARPATLLWEPPPRRRCRLWAKLNIDVSYWPEGLAALAGRRRRPFGHPRGLAGNIGFRTCQQLAVGSRSETSSTFSQGVSCR